MLKLSSSAVPQPPPLPAATERPKITPLPAATATLATPSSDADTIMRAQCPTSHSLERIRTSRKTRDQWTPTMNRMVKLCAADQSVLLDDLTQNYRQ